MPDPQSSQELKDQLYIARLEADRLRREVYAQVNPAASLPLLDALAKAEASLAELEARLTQALKSDPAGGLLLEFGTAWAGTLGAQTTGIEVEVRLRMAQVATAVYHLLNKDENPLVTCSIRNLSDQTRRLRITSFIEEYSAKAIDTLEIDPGGSSVEIHQLPTLFPRAIATLNELTRATLNVMIEDLGDIENRIPPYIESHTTHPIWLLARTTAPLAVRDPKTGEWVDLTRYLGAFVTPNAPDLMAFLRMAASIHPQKRLAGYQGDASQVEPQVRALFDALKRSAEIAYVNSVIAFSPDQGASSQRVRLPRESLSTRQANCIDGVVLFASLLEAVSLSPALVIIPGHAFVGWETWNDTSAEWRYAETTMIGSSTFDEAVAAGGALASRYRKLSDDRSEPSLFRQWPLKKLRTELGITPLE